MTTLTQGVRTPIALRNRQHLIQLLNGADTDALREGFAEVWFLSETGVTHTVHATPNAARRVHVKLNGARSSRDAILRAAGY